MCFQVQKILLGKEDLKEKDILFFKIFFIEEFGKWYIEMKIVFYIYNLIDF